MTSSVSTAGDEHVESGGMGNRLWHFVREKVAPPSLLLILLVAAWGWYVHQRQSLVIPTPGDVAAALKQDVLPTLRQQLGPTLGRVLEGYMIGLTAGLLLGVLTPLNRWVYAAYYPFQEFFRSLPATALFPVFSTLFHDGDFSRVCTAIYITVWLTSFNTSRAMMRVSPRRRDYLQAAGAGTLFQIRHLYLYELLPAVMASARVALSLTLLVIVSVEMLIGAQSGLGMQIFDFHYSGDYAGMTAIILLVGLLGLLMNKLVEAAESRAVYWRED